MQRSSESHQLRRYVEVSFTAEGWHRWPRAPVRRDYLKARHRHLFHIRLRMEVRRQNREIEFHDLLDQAKAAFGTGDFGSKSCECLAHKLVQHFRERPEYRGRAMTASVSEDGECGAGVSVE